MENSFKDIHYTTMKPKEQQNEQDKQKGLIHPKKMTRLLCIYFRTKTLNINRNKSI